jgi:Protein kinase domain
VVGVLQPSDPRLIGPYQLIGRLGAGGMGRVFLGMSAARRPVAVKIIHAELAADPEFRARFSVEVAAARKVSGLFTALVVDADVDAPVPWLATAYVSGPSLSEAVRDRGPLSVTSLLALAAGLAKSLSAIHAAGVVHGDLKPSNVLLAPDGPRVIDFGISQAAEAAPLGRSGLVVGTPSYMSPEQAAGQAVGPLSDVFSLGAVLAFAATGRKPFGTGQAAAVVERVVRGAPDLRDAPPGVLPLIERCLAKEPARRPAATGLLDEVAAVQAALVPAAEPDPVALPAPRRRWQPLVTASAVAGILAAGAAAGYGLNAVTGAQASRSYVAEAAGKPPAGVRIGAGDARTVRSARPRSAAAPPPRITAARTYQQGEMVYFVIYYSDPGHDAVGFGFRGVDESDLPTQVIPFSDPGAGVIEAGIISYPLNQGCGTGLEYTSSVKAWIYDKAGGHSKPVVIHLACTT